MGHSFDIGVTRADMRERALTGFQRNGGPFGGRLDCAGLFSNATRIHGPDRAACPGAHSYRGARFLKAVFAGPS